MIGGTEEVIYGVPVPRWRQNGWVIQAGRNDNWRWRFDIFGVKIVSTPYLPNDYPGKGAAA